MSEPVVNPTEIYFRKVTRFHIYFLSIYFLSRFMLVWHTFNIIFLSPPMKYTCGPVQEGKPERQNVCPCDNPVWDFSTFTKTVQSKYGIICEKTWLIRLSESISFFGLLIGAIVFGMLSDRFGRLVVYSSCQFIIGLSGCLVTIAPSMLVFCIIRFFEGVGSGGAGVAGYVLCAEFCGVNYRSSITTTLHLASNLGLIAMAGISYLIRNCDHFQLTVSVPVLMFCMVQFLLLESPKWLLDKNKKDKAINTLESICRFNKKPYNTVRTRVEAYLASRTEEDMKTMKFYHIFKFKEHSKNFCVMCYMYFVCGMCYYGVSQFIGQMSSRVHLNIVFNGTLLAVGTFSSIYVVNKFGRRPFLRTTMFLAGVFMISVAFLPETGHLGWVRTMCACFSSSFFYISFIIIFLLVIELFPTNIRSSTLGVLSLVSRVGQVIGPQINYLSHYAAAATFGMSAIIACILTIFLPETKGAELPSTLKVTSRVRFNKVVMIKPLNEDTTPESSTNIVIK